MAELRTGTGTREHRVVSREAWTRARKALLVEEKRFTRLRDRLTRARQALPWVRIDKPYVFDGPRGKVTLPELFAGRRQLLVWHFMFAPNWREGCDHCSFWADNFNPNVAHLRARDTEMIAVSRAPLARIRPFQKRMGWTFTWVSSFGSDFNYDFHVSFRPEEVRARRADYNYGIGDPLLGEREGVSAFYKDREGAVYHTYSTYARGVDLLNTAYNYLDLTAKGRDEEDSDSSWVRYHDRYRH